MRSRLVREEHGFAMAAVVMLTAALAILGVTLISLVSDESTRAVAAERGGTALQAAEAGIDDYLAKLVEDKTYYLRQVHPAESTRLPTSGAAVDPSDTCVVQRVAGQDVKAVTQGGVAVSNTGPAWTGSPTWTFPNGKDNWCQLANGYEYNLQITPPVAGDVNIKILSTGRKVGNTTDRSQWRAIETWVHFSLVSDFQMIANQNISYGVTATTNGKIYAGRDASGVNHSVNHAGTATADIYAEGSITGNPTMLSGAQKISGAALRNVPGLAQPINFASFQLALNDIKRAAQLSGNYYDASSPARRVVFQADGHYTIANCTLTGGADPAQTAPSCGAATTRAVPANGAIYSETTVIVSGQVNGRVTVASNDDIVVPADISYVQSGDDVLGLIGKNEVLVAYWSPTNLNWRAGTIAQNGMWRSWTGTTSKGTMNFTGSTATDDGGYMSMFATRNYNYDPTLQYLPPPWFPALDDAYVIDLFREVTP